MTCAPRDIVTTNNFTEELKEIKSDPKRADEFIRGAEWVLAKDPFSGQQAYPGSPVYILPGHEFSELESIVIYYAFDSKNVYFLGIRDYSE